MAQFTAEQIEQILAACAAHVADFGDTFRTHLDCALRLTAGEPKPYSVDALSAFESPGLAVSLVVGEQGIVLLLPDSLSLPAWYRQPNISENNRLQSFAQEVSLQFLPDDLPADRAFAAYAANLKEFAEQTPFDATAKLLELLAFDAEAAESDSPIATIAVIVPANLDLAAIDEAINAQAAAAAMESEASETGSFPDAELEASPDYVSSDGISQDGVSPDTGLSLDQALRALRIMNVPVTVSVRLAQRKMPLGQIVALVPGALVPFNKSCEELLDLFVNNYRYCQGEAIKIGENFGLKIARIGGNDEQKEHAL
jgi:flagellar motor switch protein FliN/FliY